MTDRSRVPTDAKWAKTVGYSRAVRVGSHVHVSGTVALDDDGSIAHSGNPYLQARRCLEIIVRALGELGAAAKDVVRTRMYVRNPDHWEDVGRAHGEVFAEAMPATTMVFTGFIDPEILVEIEAEAIVD